MFINVIFIFVSVNILLYVSADDVSQWLPKCCPKGKQLSYDGKSCIEDLSGKLEYNLTDSDSNLESPADNLLVSVDNKTILYKLEHKSKFNCVRHEVFVIGDDLFATPAHDVIVVDESGDNWTLSFQEVCVDSIDLMGMVPDRVYVALLCPDCQRVRCFHKCCPESQALQVSDDGNKVNCIPLDEASLSDELLRNHSERTFVFHGFPECPNSIYLSALDAAVEVESQGHLRLGLGRIHVPRTHYCVDRAPGNPDSPALLACRQLQGGFKPTMYGGLFVLGAVFLAVTLGLHLWLPELRKSLHSRVLVAHIFCMLAGYVVLAVANLVYIPGPSTVCSATAFAIQFSILATIFWLNVMCVDIAWTFSGLRAPHASQTLDSDGHKFLYYSLYAWGSTLAISGVTAFLEFSPTVPPTSRFKPSFGTLRCWFTHWESILLLVYGPMGVLLLANIVLFVYTAVKIRRTQQDTANLVQHAGSKLRNDKRRLMDVESVYHGTTANKRVRFSLYLKLFGLMGVTWVFEVVSWIVGGSESYWYVTDTINALRGVFIFALFCIKEKVLVLIKAKLSIGKTPKFPIHPRKSPASSKMTSSLTSQRTNSIQLSQIS